MLKDSGMDKTLLDISCSGCSDEQIFVQKNIINYNARPIAQLGLKLSTAKGCVEPEQNNDSGAGANAGSSKDMVFVTTDPLSELVWSPHKGLYLKRADRNLSDKKGVFWGMVVSSPPSISIGQNYNVEGGSSENMKELTKEEGTDLNTSCEGDLPDKNGKRVCGLTVLQPLDTSVAWTKTISSYPEKASGQGLDNEGSLDPSSTEQSGKEHYPVQVILESEDSERGTSSDQYRGQRDACSGNSHTAGVDDEPTFNSTSKCGKLPHMSACNSHGELALAIPKEDVKGTSTASSNFIMERDDSASDCDFKPLKGKNDSVELDVTSHPVQELMQNIGRNAEPPQHDVVLAEDSPDNRKIPLYQETEKGKILSSAFSDTRIQNDDDCPESVESCSNSKGLILAGKRPQSFDQNLVVGNKKMKAIHDNSNCTSIQRHGSSFMNWISNMVKGASKSNLKETTSLDLVMRSSNHDNGSDDQHLMLQEGSQQSLSTSTGFGTVFKALYCSRTNFQEAGISNIDQFEERSKGHDLDNRKCDQSSFPLTCGEDNMKLRKETSIFTGSPDICEDAVSPSSPSNMQFANVSAVQEEHDIGAAEKDNLITLPSDHGKEGQVSSSSEEKETHKVVFSAPLKCAVSTINRSHPLGSQWITRFCPPVSGLMIDSPQCEQKVDTAFTGPTGCIAIPSQNGTVSVDNHSNLVDCQEPPTEDDSGFMNKALQDCVDRTAGPFGPIRITEETDQTLKPVTDTVEPSQSFTSSEAMASVFSRRVDTIRHMMLSEAKGNTSHATITCIFCGLGGHKLQECLDVTESELEALLRKPDSSDGAEEAPFLCIRCFDPNHWAISCPNISSKKRSHSGGSSALLDFRNVGKISHAPRSDNDINKEKRTLSDNFVCRGAVALTVSDGKKQRLQTEFRAGTDANENMNNVMFLSRTYPDEKLTMKEVLENNYCEGKSLRITSTEYILNGKQTRKSSSTESKEYQITAFDNFVSTQIPTIPRGTFEAIKKLRLSRTDIFKWRRSMVSLFTLEGFFVRLRLRKSEKEPGTTGYYVARINGGLREKLSGSSKAPLSVKIGGFTCLVECRFISNHDFLEDELLAWWCATLKSGGNIPSENDLEMKLKERNSFEF